MNKKERINYIIDCIIIVVGILSLIYIILDGKI